MDIEYHQVETLQRDTLIVDRQDDGHRINGVLEGRHLAEDSARRRCGYSMMMIMMMTLNRRLLCSLAINIKQVKRVKVIKLLYLKKSQRIHQSTRNNFCVKSFSRRGPRQLLNDIQISKDGVMSTIYITGPTPTSVRMHIAIINVI